MKRRNLVNQENTLWHVDSGELRQVEDAREEAKERKDAIRVGSPLLAFHPRYRLFDFRICVP